ncbi:hypothetical protein MRB53_002581 [Persea americana]|uniref:Uncharacterized protein n=1 Tax=Persea americana TaxID=3435 RepID=A0ACC2MVU7_PERAE|nr:hypothetical protein MRB53_002581 [Persea americana]
MRKNPSPSQNPPAPATAHFSVPNPSSSHIPHASSPAPAPFPFQRPSSSQNPPVNVPVPATAPFINSVRVFNGNNFPSLCRQPIYHAEILHPYSSSNQSNSANLPATSMPGSLSSPFILYLPPGHSLPSTPPILFSNWDNAQLELLRKYLDGLVRSSSGQPLGDLRQEPATLSLVPHNSITHIPHSSQAILVANKPPNPPPTSQVFSAKQIEEFLKMVSSKVSQKVQPPPPSKSLLDLFPDSKPLSPAEYPPSSLKEGKLTMKIPSIMIEPGKKLLL